MYILFYEVVACRTSRPPRGFHEEVSDQHSCQVLDTLDTQANDNIASKPCPTILKLKNICHEA